MFEGFFFNYLQNVFIMTTKGVDTRILNLRSQMESLNTAMSQQKKM